MIEELSRKLKNRRKELGYTIDYIVEKTKLHPSVINSIEECEFDKIGIAYVKGFIKIYASFLGVETEGALEENITSKPAKRKPSVQSGQNKTGVEISKRKRKKIDFYKFIRIIQNIPLPVRKNAAIALLGFLIMWGIFSAGRMVVRNVADMFKHKENKTETVSRQKPPVADEKTENAVKSNDVKVSVTAKKKCFLRVIVDGNVLFEGVLNKGAVETWKGNDEIEFRISDGSAVYLEANGKAISTLSSIHKPIKSLKITSLGISVEK